MHYVLYNRNSCTISVISQEQHTLERYDRLIARDIARAIQLRGNSERIFDQEELDIEATDKEQYLDPDYNAFPRSPRLRFVNNNHDYNYN